MSRSLMIMPDEGAQPRLDPLAAANRSLRVKMFLFDDPSLLADESLEAQGTLPLFDAPADRRRARR
jgi:hypothetical protein